MTEQEFLALESREQDALVAEKVMGYSCVHESETMPSDVLVEEYAAEWLEEHGTVCPDAHAQSQVEQYLDCDYPPRWCKHCHCRYSQIDLKKDTGTWARRSYMTSIENAWQVVEKMQEEGFAFAVWGVPEFSSVFRGTTVAFRRDVYPPRLDFDYQLEDRSDATGNAPDAPLAICIAALKAKGEIEC
jgi:hypothetical protein